MGGSVRCAARFWPRALSRGKGNDMSMDRSLKAGAGLVRHRNVLTRDERVTRLESEGKWDESKSVQGLVKVGNRKLIIGGKAEKKTDDAAAAPAAKGAKGAAAPAARERRALPRPPPRARRVPPRPPPREPRELPRRLPRAAKSNGHASAIPPIAYVRRLQRRVASAISRGDAISFDDVGWRCRRVGRSQRRSERHREAMRTS